MADKDNTLRFTEGTVPYYEQLLNRAHALQPFFAREHRGKFEARDVLLAWVLSAAARRRAFLAGFDTSAMKLETWVLAQSPRADHGSLSAWFPRDEVEHYRVLVHREPSAYRGKRIPYMSFFLDAHDYLRPRVRHRPGPTKQLIPSAREFLAGLLNAYRRSQSGAEAYVASSGHPYYASNGAY